MAAVLTCGDESAVAFGFFDQPVGPVRVRRLVITVIAAQVIRASECWISRS